jgi:hypothetical protein
MTRFNRPEIAILRDKQGVTHAIKYGLAYSHIEVEPGDIGLLIEDLDNWDADRFEQGLCQVQTMSAELWQTWTADALDLQSSAIALTVERAVYGSASAMALGDHSEIVAPYDEVPNLAADVSGWDALALKTGKGFIVVIDSAEWDSWLEFYRVVEPAQFVDDLAFIGQAQ